MQTLTSFVQKSSLLVLHIHALLWMSLPWPPFSLLSTCIDGFMLSYDGIPITIIVTIVSCENHWWVPLPYLSLLFSRARPLHTASGAHNCSCHQSHSCVHYSLWLLSSLSFLLLSNVLENGNKSVRCYLVENLMGLAFLALYQVIFIIILLERHLSKINI